MLDLLCPWRLRNVSPVPRPSRLITAGAERMDCSHPPKKLKPGNIVYFRYMYIKIDAGTSDFNCTLKRLQHAAETLVIIN